VRVEHSWHEVPRWWSGPCLEYRRAELTKSSPGRVGGVQGRVQERAAAAAGATGFRDTYAAIGHPQAALGISAPHRGGTGDSSDARPRARARTRASLGAGSTGYRGLDDDSGPHHFRARNARAAATPHAGRERALGGWPDLECLQQRGGILISDLPRDEEAVGQQAHEAGEAHELDRVSAQRPMERGVERRAVRQKHWWSTTGCVDDGGGERREIKAPPLLLSLARNRR